MASVKQNTLICRILHCLWIVHTVVCIPSTSVVNCILTEAGPAATVTAATEHEYAVFGWRKSMCMEDCGPDVVKWRPVPELRSSRRLIW